MKAPDSGNSVSAPQHCSPTSRRRRLLVVIVVVLVVGIGFLWAVKRARMAARRQTCKGRMFSISCALRDYHSQYGCFPPAYLTDDTGKPTHSWRVLILPFLGEPGALAD